MRKSVAIIAAVGCILLLLAGCEEMPSPTEKTTDPADPSSSSVTTNENDPTETTPSSTEEGETTASATSGTGTTDKHGTTTTAKAGKVTTSPKATTRKTQVKTTTKTTYKEKHKAGEEVIVTVPTAKTTAKPVPTTTTKAVPQTPLSELSSSKYYGRAYLAKQTGGTALVKLYDTLVTEAPKLAVAIDVDKLSPTQVRQVVQCYRSDYPQHFWVDYTYKLATLKDKPNEVLKLYLTYLASNASDLATQQKKFDAAVKEVLNGVSGSLSDYDRALLLHDRLIQRVNYGGGTHQQSAYGALVEKKSVCEGYARAYQYLCYKAGLQCLLVHGGSRIYSHGTAAGEEHIWNMVCVNGQYMNVDVTWDDPSGEGLTTDFVSHMYFGLTDAGISADHGFTVQTVNYTYPSCTKDSLFYYRYMNAYFNSYNVQNVAALLNAHNGKAAMYFSNGTSGFSQWLDDNAVELMGKLYGNYKAFKCTFNENEITLECVPK